MKDSTTQYDERKALILPVNSQSEILLQDRRGHKPPPWGYFGGEIEAGEEPIEAAIREIKEELDLDLSDTDLEYLGHIPVEWKGSKISRHMYLYRTDQVNFNVLEGKAARWLSIDEAREKIFDDIAFDVLKDKLALT